MSIRREIDRNYTSGHAGGVGVASGAATRSERATADQSVVDRIFSPGWFEFAIETLGPKEFRRRLWHFAPGVLALGGAVTSSLVTAPTHETLILVLCALALPMAALCCQHSIRRAGERNCLAAILGYSLIVIPMFVIFPSHRELAMTVAGIVAFGDGSATLAGLLFGDRKLPWNRRKSWAGAMAFVLVGLPLATSIYWFGSTVHPTVAAALLCVGPAVLMAALVESLPFRLNDNVFVGISAAATLIAMQGLVVGW
jgi:phytol kinase